MLALEEKVRTVVLFKSELNDTHGDEIFEKFRANYLDVKAHKQVFITRADSDAYFKFLKQDERPTGLIQVAVLENLEGDILEETLKLVELLRADLPTGGFYCSQGAWEAARDLEYFFPHLGELPVERTLALIKPDGLARGTIDGQTLEQMVEDRVALAGLVITGKRLVTLKPAEAQELCRSLEGTPAYQGSVSVLLADPGSIALCIEGPGAIGKWNLMCGPANCGIARERAPDTLRAKWGTDGTSNALHASESMDAAEVELEMIFPEGILALQRTLCIVKPDAMPDLLQIRDVIEEKGFTVLSEKQAVLTEERAKEFYSDLKDKPFFNALVKHACSGTCCLLVLCRLEAVSVWQQVIGPEVVKEARNTRPNSLRARFGRDGQRNAVHGSDSLKSAAREVRFFFPELGADAVPNDDEVRDYLFRKSAQASMDLKTLDTAEGLGLSNLDSTLQQLLSQGLIALCQAQPKGLSAIKWLSRWLMENNPNRSQEETGYDFAPPERTRRVIEHGVNQDGLPFAVEAPSAPKKKQVIDVDVSQEIEEQRLSDLSTPPFVVFLLGGPGVGKGTQCAKLRKDFNLVHLSTGDLMRQEVAAKTYLGTEIYKHMQQGTLVPDGITLQLLKKTMVKNQDTNRFLIDGFPRSVEQAKRFEQEIAEFAFGLYFEASPLTMRKRVNQRSIDAPGRVDDNPETLEKRINIFQEQSLPVVDYYMPIGKIRCVKAEIETSDGTVEKNVEEVYSEAKQFFSCKFLYLLAPPSFPTIAVAERLEAKYGYSTIDFTALLKAFVDGGGKDAEKVATALRKGKPVDASIACPLVLSEIYRDMALGVQQFVICDFPQSRQQADFLEFRIPSIGEVMLLDYTRTDAEDLDCICCTGASALELEIKSNAFFEGDVRKMIDDFRKGEKPVTSVPSSLAGVESQEQLVDSAWRSVCTQVMPGLTLVLGLPGSGVNVLAKLLAASTPNTYAVDCDELLDKELERRTEIGLTMHNMLARGQVVPLSMTLGLLKNVAGLTCSRSLVITSCPMYVDQIEYIAKEFRIDRVFYINGDEKALETWRDSFCQQRPGEDPAQLGKMFNEHIERLQPIVTHFSRLGKLQQFDVRETPDAKKLASMIIDSSMPQFAVISGLSQKATSVQANLLAGAYGVGEALTSEYVKKWAAETLKRVVDPTEPEQFFSALQQYAEQTAYSLLVLDRYPSTDKEVVAFQKYFGDPRVVVNMNVDEESHMEQYKEENPEDETPEEELAEQLEAARKQQAGTIEEFKAKCGPIVMTVNMKEVAEANTPPETISMQVRTRLLPKVYVLVAPAGKNGFSGRIANAICTSRREGQKRPVKFTTIDSSTLFLPGGHSSAIEDKLRKEAFTAEAPDAVSVPLWKELFAEAMKQSANPLGTFVITNFPTPCCLTSSPTIRDQFSMLESISTFMGIIHVKVSEKAYSMCVADDGEYAQYADFEGQVKSAALVQVGSDKIKECVVDQCSSADDAAKTAAADFLSFHEKAEQARK